MALVGEEKRSDADSLGIIVLVMRHNCSPLLAALGHKKNLGLIGKQIL